MQIIFFGTSEFAVPILRTIKEKTDWAVDLVISEPAKPAGRKQELAESPVSVYAKSLGLKITTPPSLKSAEVVDAIRSARPDIGVVAAYGRIIPPEVFNLPPHKTLNIHPSLLPKLRGPSPIQTALRIGLKETGVSLMTIDEKIDHGPVISQETLTIDDDDNYITLESKLADLGGQMIIRDVPRYISGALKPQPQNHAQATRTKIIKKEDGLIDWSRTADEIYNQWRAFVRWPGIFTFFKDRRGKTARLKLIEIVPSRHNHGRAAGEVFLNENKELLIACSGGSIKPTKLQPEGGKILTPKEFLNGYGYIVGQKLFAD